MNKFAIIDKNIGETPLEALERFRSAKIDEVSHCSEVGKCDDANSEIQYWKNIPMTYAGRLDPMAEGKLIILIGQECKNKDNYLGLNKEYEVEVLFGIDTDTYDVLGIVNQDNSFDISVVKEKIGNFKINSFVGKFEQEYPAFSSKTVDGVQLHNLARQGNLPNEMPKKEVEIYSIECISRYEISGGELKERVFGMIDKVKGDFRQNEIKKSWNDVTDNTMFLVLKLRVRCSSGTYMRSLAHRFGDKVGTSACALSINRTKFIGIDIL